MIIRQPIIWVTLLYITGIVLGSYFSSIYFLYAAAILPVASMLLRRKTRIADVLLFAFWISLGMARMWTEKEIPSKNGLYEVVCQKAQQQQETMTARLGNAGVDKEALSVSSALLLGQKSGLDKDTRKKYAQVGASHLLALSGMHLGIIYGVLYMLFIRRIRYSEWKWFWLPPILLAIWGYAFVAGMPISLVRACIMFSIATMAAFAQSDTPPLHVLALSALIILLFSPSSLFEISFQLSFLAVFFIIALYQPLRECFKRHNFVTDTIILSAVAQIGTAPLSIYYFHTLPLTGVITSVILIPLTTLIIYLGMLTLLIPLHCFAWLLTIAIRAQEWIVDAVAGIPYTTITNLYPTWWNVLLVYLLLLCVIARSHIYWNREDFNR